MSLEVVALFVVVIAGLLGKSLSVPFKIKVDRDFLRAKPILGKKERAGFASNRRNTFLVLADAEHHIRVIFNVAGFLGRRNRVACPIAGGPTLTGESNHRAIALLSNGSQLSEDR